MCTLLKLGDDLLLGNVAILESFHQFCGLDAVISCLDRTSKNLILDWCVYSKLLYKRTLVVYDRTRASGLPYMPSHIELLHRGSWKSNWLCDDS